MKKRTASSLLVLLIAPWICFSQQVNKQKNRINLSSQGVLAYSKDQSFLAVSDQEEVKLYAAETFKLSKTLSGHSRNVTAISFSPDGTHLLTASLDKKLILWDYLKGTVQVSVEVGDEILGACLIDNNRAAVITEKKLVLYDLHQKSIVFTRQEHKKPIRSLSRSEDGKMIFTGGGDGKVVVYDAATGNVIRALEDHKGYVRAIDISVDGKVVASGDDDGRLIISDAESGQSRFSFDDAKGWIRTAKFSMDGKYVAAGDDWGTIFIYSMEKGVLTEKISTGSAPILSLAFSPDGKELSFLESLKAVRVWSIPTLGISSVFRLRDEKDLTPPQIFVSSPPNIQEDKIRVFKDLIEIRGTLMDESGIRGLKINGIEVPIKDNNNFVMFMPLTMGDNHVSIEARDINENFSVRRFTIQRKNAEGEQYDVVKARNFLFVVGINDYEFWPKLNNAVKDANDITNTLLQMYNFQFDHLTFLKNEQATRSNIYRSLRALIEQVTPQDNLMIYYSGHGFFDPLLNEGYWIPADAEVNSTGDYLSNSDLLKIIGNIDSQHTFLIADACFSGSLFGESKRGYAENVEKFRSRWGLASGRLEVVSDGEVGKNSPFASSVLDFLRNNKKDKVAISELVQAVKLKVAEVSDQTPLGNPLKVAGDEGGELVLYRKN